MLVFCNDDDNGNHGNDDDIMLMMIVTSTTEITCMGFQEYNKRKPGKKKSQTQIITESSNRGTCNCCKILANILNRQDISLWLNNEHIKQHPKNQQSHYTPCFYGRVFVYLPVYLT